MSLHLLQKTALTRRFLLALAAPRARETVDHFAHYLQPGERILDVGSGICDITKLLIDQGQQVTALDVKDFSFVPDVHPVLYDGQHMPFAPKQFDTALILTVLHHTPNPEAVLQEATRVARRVIITEDVYYNIVHKYATFFMDSLLNLEFLGHPHSNKTDAQWREVFRKAGLHVKGEKAMGSFLVLRHRMYVLETA
jgi:ubiquinone/menaquinone biosynthesis C-methylase UbiE